MPLPASSSVPSRAERANNFGSQRVSSASPPSRQRWPALAISAATGSLSAYFLASVVSARPGHDQSWLLYAAGRVLTGTTLDGPALIETNPPLAVWSCVIPSQLATWFHASPTVALTLFASVLICLSSLWSIRILRASGFLATPALLCLAFAALAALQASVSAVDFGQREHFLVILLLPYLLESSFGLSRHPSTRLGLPERIALGIAGGVAICLKPQQLLTLVSFELLLLLQTRRPRRLLRPELVSLALVPCLYLLLVRIATPPYLTQIVPLLRKTYWAFGTRTIPSLLHDNLLLVGISLVSVVAWFALRKHLRYPAAPLGFMAAGFGAALAFLLQRTSWHYHFLPWKDFFLMSLICMSLDLLSSRVDQDFRVLPAAAIFVLFTAISLPVCLAARRPLARKIAEGDIYLNPTLDPLPAGTPVYIFSTTVEGFDLVLQNHLVWASRYAHLWMLPAILRNETGEFRGESSSRILSPSTLHQLETLQRANTTEDLRRYQPSVVLVERCSSTYRCPMLEDMHVDILAWFQQSPAFAAEWAHYSRQSDNPRYAIYRRTPDAASH